MNHRKIVFLDRKSIGDDLDLSAFEELGQVVMYDFTEPEQVAERVKDAEIIILNKTPINKETLGAAENLRLVCVTATGTNNLDKEYLESSGIAWRNVAGYSTDSVAQHTFALLFYLYEHLPYYDNYVKSGAYGADTLFTHFAQNFHELKGKTWGILGLGAIGRRVAEIATAFGLHVIYTSTSGKNHTTDYEEVSFSNLLARADILSVHAPLDQNTEGLMNYEAFSKMKQDAIFLNLGRGAIVVEEDLCRALDEGLIQAAGLDVLEQEPMNPDSPLLRVKEEERLFITPHIAWASVEARQRLMEIIYHQVCDFYKN